MASTCINSPRNASRRSIPTPAACSPRFRRRAMAATQDSHGPRGRSGWGTTGSARSTRSIPRPGRSCAPSNRIALSPASRGPTVNSGTPPWKMTRVSCGASTRSRARSWRHSKCPPERLFRDSNPTAAISSSAAAGRAAKSGLCVVRSAPKGRRKGCSARRGETRQAQYPRPRRGSLQRFQNVFRHTRRLRLVPALLEIFLPDLRPRPAVVIHELRVVLGQLLRPSIDIVDVGQTLYEGEALLRSVQRRAPQEAIRDADRLEQRLRIVENDPLVEPDELPLGIERGLENFHGLELAAVLEQGVLSPGLHVGSPGDECRAVPEADGFAIPLWNLLHVLLADQYLAHEIVRDPGQELYLVGGHGELKVAAPGRPGPPARETFRKTEFRIPLFGVIDSLVVQHLHVASLVLGCEEGHDRGSLLDPAPEPALTGHPQALEKARA